MIIFNTFKGLIINVILVHAYLLILVDKISDNLI